MVAEGLASFRGQERQKFTPAVSSFEAKIRPHEPVPARGDAALESIGHAPQHCRTVVITASRLFGSMGRNKLASTQELHERDFVGTKGAAVLLRMSVSTVQKMVESSALEAWRTPGGHRRIPMSAIRRLIAQKADARPASQGRPVKVLLVEDSKLSRRSVELLLERWGRPVELHLAADGAEALLRLDHLLPDVLITDIVMKPLDGRALMQAVWSNPGLSHLRVLVVSGHLPADEALALFDDRTVVWPKPLNFERLAGYLDAQVQSIALGRL